METSLTNVIFTYMDFHFCQFSKRRAPKNDEGPSNRNLPNHGYETNIYKKHEWIFSNMVPISTAKHKKAFGEFLKCR